MRLRVIDGEWMEDESESVTDIIVEVPSSLMPEKLTAEDAETIVESVKVALEVIRETE